MLNTLKAVYDGRAFIPEVPCNLPAGSIVMLVYEQEPIPETEKAKKLAALKELKQQIAESNQKEPLPPEFDEIILRRVNISRR